MLHGLKEKIKFETRGDIEDFETFQLKRFHNWIFFSLQRKNFSAKKPNGQYPEYL